MPNTDICRFLYKKNRLHQIKGFYYAVRHQSLSKAAEAIHLTQSTISLQIQSLERDLGFRLIRRDSKVFKLTREGEEFYKEACPLVQQFESVVESFLTSKTARSKKNITIAIHHIAISYLLPKIIASFKKKYNSIEFLVQNITTTEAITRLKEGQIDLAFYPNLEEEPEIELTEVASYKPILIMNKKHKLAHKKINSIKDIADQDLIRIDNKAITLPHFKEEVQKYKIKSSVKFENGNWEILKHFIKDNDDMLAVVSTICIDKYDDYLVTKDLSKIFPKMNYSIATKKGVILNDITREFIEEIKQIQ